MEKLCSNSLAMIRNMTDTDLENEAKLNVGRKLSAGGSSKFPDWLSAGDRRLLQSTAFTPNVVVAADGSGDYRTVSAAVSAAPEKSKTRYVIPIQFVFINVLNWSFIYMCKHFFYSLYSYTLLISFIV